MEGCNQFRTEEWSNCSATCGRGLRTRKVWCDNPDERECLDRKPASEEQCIDRGAHCKECSVRLFGNGDFTGWEAGFGPGKYTTEDMIAGGAKCEEVSSVKVHGHCCRATMYQYGDFNGRNKGREADLGHGDHDIDALADAGIEDNDISSMKIWLDQRCAHRTLRDRAAHLFRSGSLRRDTDGGEASSRTGGETGGATSGSADEASGGTGGATGGGTSGNTGGGTSGSREDPAREEPSPEPEGKKQNTQWLVWVLLAFLVVAVGAGIFFAVRRRQQQQ